MDTLARLKHPGWVGVVLPLLLAVASTLTPEVIRGILLAIAVVASAWIFCGTQYAGGSLKKTGVVFAIFVLMAVGIFIGARFLDTRSRVLAPEKKESATVVNPASPSPSPALPPKRTAVSTQAIPAPRKARNSVEEKTPEPRQMGNDNTLVNVPAPPSMGSGNTIVGPTDPNGNTIFNKGGTAIGQGATADSTSIAIGANAHAGAPVTVQPGGIASFGQQGGQTAGTIINNGPPPPHSTVSIKKISDNEPISPICSMRGGRVVSRRLIAVTGSLIPKLKIIVSGLVWADAPPPPPILILAIGPGSVSIDNVSEGEFFLNFCVAQLGDVRISVGCIGSDCTTPQP